MKRKKKRRGEGIAIDRLVAAERRGEPSTARSSLRPSGMSRGANRSARARGRSTVQGKKGRLVGRARRGRLERSGEREEGIAASARGRGRD